MAGMAFGVNGKLSFTVELVDAVSGNVIGTARQLNLGSSNLQPYKNLSMLFPRRARRENGYN